jgi:hypothetical protein
LPGRGTTFSPGLLTLDRWQRYQRVFDDVAAERESQVAQWGDQQLPFGTGSDRDQLLARAHRDTTQKHAADGTVTWRDVLLEEVFEAMAESDPHKLRDELVQMIAVGTKMIEDIDRAAAGG